MAGRKVDPGGDTADCAGDRSRASATTSAAIGQTLAAQDLCTRIVRPYLRTHYVQPNVGHYGVFSGKRWQGQIYPLLRETIHLFDQPA